MKNLLSFFKRTWPLMLFTLFTNWLVLTQHHFAMLGAWELQSNWWEWKLVPHTPFEAFGAILYVPPFASLVFLTALFLIHLRFPKTIEADAASNRDVQDWNACTASERAFLRVLVFVGLVIALCILCSGLAKAAPIPVDQVARWQMAQINPKYSMALDVVVASFKRNEARYQKIQAMRTNGVPAPIIFCMHYRESDNDFKCHAHEGSPLTHRTRDVPKGRLPFPAAPPFTFEQSAEDAYYVCDKLQLANWHSLQSAMDKLESFNGFGYRTRRPFIFDGKGVSSYLASGTSLYRGGKFIRDGVYSATAMDGQLGCIAILKRMQQRGITLPF